MTKILNSLKVTGTGSSGQALGVTGGYVSINDSLYVGATTSTNNIKLMTGITNSSGIYGVVVRDSVTGHLEVINSIISSGSNSFIQGGNTFSAIGVLGTKDNYQLQLIVNNSNIVTFTTQSNYLLNNTTIGSTSSTASGILNIISSGTSSGYSIYNIDGNSNEIFKVYNNGTMYIRNGIITINGIQSPTQSFGQVSFSNNHPIISRSSSDNLPILQLSQTNGFGDILQLNNNGVISTRFDIDNNLVISTGSIWYGSKYGIGLDIQNGLIGSNSNSSMVGLFATSSYGGSLIIKSALVTDNHISYGLSGSNTTHIIGDRIGINTLLPTSLLHINSYTSSSTFRITNNESDIINVWGSGLIGIGTSTPSLSSGRGLHIVGITNSFRLQDGNELDGRALISYNNGEATWRDINRYVSGSGLTSSGLYPTVISVNLSSTPGLTISNGMLSFDNSIVGFGLTYSDYIKIDSRTIATSSNFNIYDSNNGYLFNVTTGTSFITFDISTISGTEDVEFEVRKSDGDIGVIQSLTIPDYDGSINLSTLTRQNQTIKYKYDSTISTWFSFVVDDGILPPQTIYANMNSYPSHAEEFPIIDINDSVQKSIDYSQGSFGQDWLNGIIYSSYKPIYNISNGSFFNYNSGEYIGMTQTLLTNQITFPAYSLQSGKSFKILMTGTSSSPSSSIMSLVISLGLNLFSGAIYTDYTLNDIWRLEYEIKVSDVGPSGSVHGSGLWTSYNSGDPLVNLMNTSIPYQSIDTTIDNILNISFDDTTFSGSTPIEIMVLHSTIERLA